MLATSLYRVGASLLKLIAGILEMMFHLHQRFIHQLRNRYYATVYVEIPKQYIETLIVESNDLIYTIHVICDHAYLHEKNISTRGISAVLCEACPEERIYRITVSEEVVHLPITLREAIYAHECTHLIHKHSYVPAYTLSSVLSYRLDMFYQWLWATITSTSVYLEQEYLADSEAVYLTSKWSVLNVLRKGSSCRDMVTRILTWKRMYRILCLSPTTSKQSWSMNRCFLKTLQR